MKITNILLATFSSIFLCVVLTGCGYPNTPVGVVEKALNAGKNGDYTTAVSCMNLNEVQAKRFIDEMNAMSAERRNRVSADMADTKILRFEINGDTAIVYTNTTDKIYLVKKDGKWLIQDK